MPNTIAQNLQRLVNAKSAISEAIIAKGGTVSTGDGFEDFPDDIATIPSGGGSGDASKPVRFIDYDGSIVASYTPEEFAELTSLPANPSHEGLTAQGWNWSLADSKAYVAKYGFIDVGQMYITDDGRTRLYVRMQEGRLSPVLKLYLNDDSQLDIDWGDDTPHSTFTSTSADYKSERHTYTSAGDYIISIGAIKGSFMLRTLIVSGAAIISTLLTNDNASSDSPDRGYASTIRKIEIGDAVTIDKYAFTGCYSLSKITIPNSVTSIESSTFSSCFSLSQIIIPNSVTSIKYGALSSCLSISQIAIPNSVTSIESPSYCYSILRVNIPNSVTSIGDYTFASCFSLSQIIIPNSVTSIGRDAFKLCYSLGFIKFEGTIPPTVSNSDAWADIPTDCKILVPRGSLSAYTSATNYPSSSTYTYEEYDI